MDGREVRLRYRLTWTPSGVISAEAEESDLPAGEEFWMRFDDGSDGIAGGVDGAAAGVAERSPTEVVPDPDDHAEAEVVPLFAARSADSEARP